MRTTSSPLQLTACIAVLLAPAAALADCPGNAPIAGVVQSVTGARSDISILRGGKTIQPVVALPVCAHDRVYSQNPSAAMVVLLADGTSRQFAGSAGEIPEVEGSSFLTRVMEDRLSALAPVIGSYGRSMVSRGPKARAPLDLASGGLAAGTAELSAGWRSIRLRWTGGSSPYSVAVTRPEGTVVTVNNVLEDTILISLGQLEAGTWRVSILDAGGSEARGEFVVNPALKAPSMAAPSPFAEVDDALMAVDLARQPTLEFEAEQVLASAPEQGLDRDTIYKTLACLNAGEKQAGGCRPAPLAASF